MYGQVVCVSKLCVDKLCVCEQVVCEAGGGREGGRQAGVHNQKQEPHTKKDVGKYKTHQSCK